MRNIFSKFALAAGFSLAITFTLSCEPRLDNSEFLSSSSSKNVVLSSSSVQLQSGITYGPSVTYQGETYQTVVIGSQTWFKRNLNYAVAGSKCGNGGYLSDVNTATCDIYGRLYDWVTAMALPYSCNSSTCAAGQVSAKHRGICPSGWHFRQCRQLRLLVQ